MDQHRHLVPPSLSQTSHHSLWTRRVHLHDCQQLPRRQILHDLLSSLHDVLSTLPQFIRSHSFGYWVQDGHNFTKSRFFTFIVRPCHLQYLVNIYLLFLVCHHKYFTISLVDRLTLCWDGVSGWLYSDWECSIWGCISVGEMHIVSKCMIGCISDRLIEVYFCDWVYGWVNLWYWYMG